MSSFTNYTKDAIGNAVLGNASFTSPSNVYLALFDKDGNEISAAGYSRVDVTGSFSNFADGDASNTAAVNFPKADADWGTVVSAGIYDASAGGNLMMKGRCKEYQTVYTGDRIQFQPGSIVFNF